MRKASGTVRRELRNDQQRIRQPERENAPSRRSTTSLRRRICTSWANHANEVHVHERAVSRFNATANSKHVMPVNERVLDRHIEGRQMSRRNDTPLVQNVLKAALVDRGHP